MFHQEYNKIILIDKITGEALSFESVRAACKEIRRVRNLKGVSDNALGVCVYRVINIGNKSTHGYKVRAEYL